MRGFTLSSGAGIGNELSLPIARSGLVVEPLCEKVSPPRRVPVMYGRQLPSLLPHKFQKLHKSTGSVFSRYSAFACRGESRAGLSFKMSARAYVLARVGIELEQIMAEKRTAEG